MTEKANNIEVDPFIAQVKLTSFRKTDKYEFPFSIYNNDSCQKGAISLNKFKLIQFQ